MTCHIAKRLDELAPICENPTGPAECALEEAITIARDLLKDRNRLKTKYTCKQCDGLVDAEQPCELCVASNYSHDDAYRD